MTPHSALHPPFLLLLLLLFSTTASLSLHQPPSTWLRQIFPTTTHQTVDGDGHGGEGYTVLPVLREEEPATAIFIHGLGGTGEEWGFVSLALSFFSLNFVKFIIPSAPVRPVTYMNETIPSWFDVTSLGDLSNSVDRRQLLNSVDRIERIIAGEVAAGVRQARIFVVGFSQGGALALTTFLRSSFALAGCVGVATWLPFPTDYPQRLSSKVKNKRILLIHGTEDDVIPIRYAWRTKNFIDSFGSDVNLSTNLTRLVGAGHLLVNGVVMNALEEYISQRATGTRRFLLALVANLTNSFDSVNNRVENSPLLNDAI